MYCVAGGADDSLGWNMPFYMPKTFYYIHLPCIYNHWPGTPPIGIIYQPLSIPSIKEATIGGSKHCIGLCFILGTAARALGWCVSC